MLCEETFDRCHVSQYNQNYQTRVTCKTTAVHEILKKGRYIVMNAKKNSCGSMGAGAKDACGCSVESIVSVDERGQMVLPKELREKAGIGAGDKLAITSWEKDGKICCIMLIKADELVGMVKERLGPLMDEMTKGLREPFL